MNYKPPPYGRIPRTCLCDSHTRCATIYDRGHYLMLLLGHAVQRPIFFAIESENIRYFVLGLLIGKRLFHP